MLSFCRLKGMMPQLDNAIIMDTLADCNNDVNAAFEKLLKISHDMGGAFQV